MSRLCLCQTGKLKAQDAKDGTLTIMAEHSMKIAIFIAYKENRKFDPVTGMGDDREDMSRDPASFAGEFVVT